MEFIEGSKVILLVSLLLTGNIEYEVWSQVTSRSASGDSKNDPIDADKLAEDSGIDVKSVDNQNDDFEVDSDGQYHSWDIPFGKSNRNREQIIESESEEMRPVDKESELVKTGSLFRFKFKRIRHIMEAMKMQSEESLGVLEHLALKYLEMPEINLELMLKQLQKKEIFKHCDWTSNLDDNDVGHFEFDVEMEFLRHVIVLEKRNYSIKYEEPLDNDMQINLHDLEPSVVLVWVFCNLLHEDDYVPFLFLYNVSS